MRIHVGSLWWVCATGRDACDMCVPQFHLWYFDFHRFIVGVGWRVALTNARSMHIKPLHSCLCHRIGMFGRWNCHPCGQLNDTDSTQCLTVTGDRNCVRLSFLTTSSHHILCKYEIYFGERWSALCHWALHNDVSQSFEEKKKQKYKWNCVFDVIKLSILTFDVQRSDSSSALRRQAFCRSPKMPAKHNKSVFIDHLVCD